MENELIEEILENFDFDRVKKVTDLLEWRYGDSDENLSTFRLIKSAQERLEYTYRRAMEKKDDCNTSCGGFQVYAGYDEEKETVTYLDLNFVITSWDASI